MAFYSFDIEGSGRLPDTAREEIADPLALRARTLILAVQAAERVARHGKEAEVAVTVRDATGAVCLRVRLISQVDVP